MVIETSIGDLNRIFFLIKVPNFTLYTSLLIGSLAHLVPCFIVLYFQEYFYFMDFERSQDKKKFSKKKLPHIQLKPCLYKKR